MPQDTAERPWHRPEDRLPEQDQRVVWLTSTGQPVQGVYHGRLWFFADMSMYVYYTPTFWRPLE